jgi:CheY-like chemotaxis protein
MAKLLISQPTGDVPHELDGEVVTIGRTPDNNIQIDDASVSAHHAKLFLVNGIYKLRDLDSTNHSYINGVAASEADLASSCRLRFGNIECAFEAGASGANRTAQDFSAQIGEKQKLVESIMLERAALLQANRDLKTKLDILTVELAELKKKTELQGIGQQPQKQIENLVRERAALLHSNKEMSVRLEAMTNASRQTPAQIPAEAADGRHVIQQLTGERNELKAKLEAAVAGLNQAAQISSGLQNQIEELLRERDALLQANSALKEKLETGAAEPPPQEQPQALRIQPSAPLPQPKLDIREMAARRVREAMDESPIDDESDDEPQMPKTPAVPTMAASAPRVPAQAVATAPLLSSWLKRAAKRKSPAAENTDAQQQAAYNDTLTIALPSAVPAVKVANGNAAKSKADADSAAESPEVKQALDLLNGMRRTLHYFLRNQKETNILEELGRNANDLFSKSQVPSLYSTNHLALALKTLLDDLNTNKHNINPSSLRTVGQSIDFFATLLDKQNLARIHDVSEAKIFALDDDTGILETVAATMEMVKLKVTTSADPLACLEKLAEENFDMILLDVGLPQMNGLDVCTRVRSLPQHKNTPIVFLTGSATVQNRVQSTLSGGNDLIGKPFSVHELAVKVLTWIYKGQLGLT